eukprot:TRINITY_DN68833_c0_g1_i1.p1 TRINITY_DN68833_c0_g1~~TRINITY_DN68833_c0_g1_i1.p1  ORF type:complete len:439 (-),score=45.18 TRINITY_DN68833_c0_g1_i1:12-1328(-)
MAQSSSPLAIDALCLECSGPQCDFKPAAFQRRALGPKDVLIDMKYCGVCHSDLTIAADHVAGVGLKTKYPFTPGHELAGICTAVGSQVTKIKVGDQVGVGCFLDSCLECKYCKNDRENLCSKGNTLTIGGDTTLHGRADSVPKGAPARGGFSSKMVVHEHFATLIPPDYPLEMAGPIMCSGITVYDPLMVNKVTQGTRVGIVGLGGLGVMGIKLARILGATVTAISRTNAKEGLAKSAGAESFLASGDPQAMAAASKSLDLVLDTIPGDHDWSIYHALLADGGKMVFLGVTHLTLALIGTGGTKTLTAGWVGGQKALQEVMDICAREKIYPNIEIVPVQKVCEVFEELDRGGDSGKRYVLDLQGSLNETTLSSWDVKPPKLSPHASLNVCGVLSAAMKAQCGLYDAPGRAFACLTACTLILSAAVYGWIRTGRALKQT